MIGFPTNVTKTGLNKYWIFFKLVILFFLYFLLSSNSWVSYLEVVEVEVKVEEENDDEEEEEKGGRYCWSVVCDHQRNLGRIQWEANKLRKRETEEKETEVEGRTVQTLVFGTYSYHFKVALK